MRYVVGSVASRGHQGSVAEDPYHGPREVRRDAPYPACYMVARGCHLDRTALASRVRGSFGKRRRWNFEVFYRLGDVSGKEARNLRSHGGDVRFGKRTMRCDVEEEGCLKRVHVHVTACGQSRWRQDCLPNQVRTELFDPPYRSTQPRPHSLKTNFLT
jgi:hypothetical protein